VTIPQFGKPDSGISSPAGERAIAVPGAIAARKRVLVAGQRTQIMGILNATPDSFSDGGRYLDVRAAVEHATAMVAAGADLIDIGGESTRPGADPVSAAEEQRRVIPIIRELAARGITVSVDTMNAATAAAAVSAGAAVINDVSGAQADPEMVDVVIATQLPFVVMHWRGPSKTMNARANYSEVVGDVRRELAMTVAELIVRGVDPAKIIVDPGLGFAKDSGHNWRVLAQLKKFTDLGLPVLVGASRKRFVGELLPSGVPPAERDLASAVIAALSAQAGAWGVRVHNVDMTRAALDVAEAWKAGAGSGKAGDVDVDADVDANADAGKRDDNDRTF
jgi:dihydropteroate synthase